ncbi:MAG: LPS export ABC transporter permease LptG [Desulfuromusa sp.]|nr:LPS export ABC transporter permease LptG [Desulfuromusa sp.]
MKILYRYIAARLIWGWLIVLLILTALFSILELVGQLDDIGEGNYRIFDAFMYVFYTLPGRVLSLTAVSALLGSIVALGSLANGNELLAMRACGLSVFRLARIVMTTGVTLMLGVLLLAQFVVPPLEHKAKINREVALADLGTLLPEGGFWTRHNNRFINVGSSTYDGGLVGVSIFEFDEQGKFSNYITAREAEAGKNGQWLCRDVRQVSFLDERIVDRTFPTLALDIFLTSEQVDVLRVIPNLLSISDLYKYIDILQERRQNTDQYRLALWQKLTLPMKIGAMIFFSLPFVFGPAREASSGRRITIGAIFGISYYYFDLAFGHVGVLLGFHPALTTLLPLTVLVFFATRRILRIR